MADVSRSLLGSHASTASTGLREKFASDLQHSRLRVREPQRLHSDKVPDSIYRSRNVAHLSLERTIVVSIEVIKSNNGRGQLREYADRPYPDVYGPLFNQIRKKTIGPISRPHSATSEQEKTVHLGSLSRSRIRLSNRGRVYPYRIFATRRMRHLQRDSVHASWLEEALRDLSEVSLEAEEEGMEVPDASTAMHTRNMLEVLSKRYDQLPYVQPIRDGRIGIKFENRGGKSNVLFIVEADGSGVMFAEIKSESHRHRASDVSKILPTGGYHAMDKAGIRRIET